MQVKANVRINNALNVKASVRAINSTIPHGTIDITSNGLYNVKEFENVEVNVEAQETLLKPLLDATKSAYYLFYGYKGESVNHLLSPSDIENVTDISYMFYKCESLQSVVLDTSSVTNMKYTFYCCEKLKKIDITHYAISSVFYYYSDYCFANCSNLEALIIRSFGKTYGLDESSFQNSKKMYGLNGQGYIYVPRDMIDILENSVSYWKQFTFRALEDYTLDGTCWGEFDDAKAGLDL